MNNGLGNLAATGSASNPDRRKDQMRSDLGLSNSVRACLRTRLLCPVITRLGIRQ